MACLVSSIPIPVEEFGGCDSYGSVENSPKVGKAGQET